jgi:putative transposase
MQPIKAKQQSSESKFSSISAKKSVKKKGDRARKKLALKEARIHQKIAPSRSYHHYMGSSNHNL